MTEGFVGAEIEQVVISALYEAFFNKRPLEFSDLANTIKNVVPLSVTQKSKFWQFVNGQIFVLLPQLKR